MANEIKIIYTPYGVKELLGSFQQVKQGAEKTGTASASSLNAISSAMSGIAEAAAGPAAALAAVGVAVAVVKAAVSELYDMALAAREVEENIGKMSDRVGASVEVLSALHVATVDNEIEGEALEKALVKLAKAASAAGSGGQEQQKAFQSLGITMQDLQRMDPGQLFVEVSKRMALLPPGTDKAALALKLFGKAGAEIIPLMNDVGAHWDEIRQKTNALGLSLKDELVSGAMAAQGAVHQLEMIGQGLATAFDAGFMYQFAGGVQTFAQVVTGDGVNAMQTLGTVTGSVFVKIAEVVTKATIYIEAFFKKLGYDIGVLRTIIKDFQNGDGKALDDDFGTYFDDRNAARQRINKARDAKLQAVAPMMQQNLRDAQSQKFGVGSKGTSGSGLNEEQANKQLTEANKLKDAYVALQQSLADNELSIQRAKDTAAEQEDKRRYDAGEMSLTEYFARRAERITAAYDAEVAAIDKKVKAADAMPDKAKTAAETQELQLKKAQETAKLAAQLQQATIKFQADVANNTADEAAAEKAMGEKNLQNEQKLATMVGDRHKASQLALQQEIDTYKDLLKQQGASDEAIAAALADYQTRGEAKISFGELQDQATAAFGDLDRSIAKVNENAGAGAISQIAATGQIIALERQRLPGLADIITKLEAAAAVSKSPEQIQAVEQLKEKYDALRISLNTVTTASTYFTNQMSQFVNSDLVDFFAEGISGAKSFGQAMEDLGNAFEAIVSKMIAKMIIYYTFAALLGWLAPGSDLLGDLFPGGPFGGGRAKGGKVKKGTTYVVGEEGPELLTMESDGYVIPNRDTMKMLGGGSAMPELQTATSVSSGSTSGERGDGGLAVAGQGVGSSAGTPGTQVNVYNQTGQPVQAQQSKGSNGQDIIELFIGRAAANVANNGILGKSIQKSFGLTRNGTIRS